MFLGNDVFGLHLLYVRFRISIVSFHMSFEFSACN